MNKFFSSVQIWLWYTIARQKGSFQIFIFQLKTTRSRMKQIYLHNINMFMCINRFVKVITFTRIIMSANRTIIKILIINYDVFFLLFFRLTRGYRNNLFSWLKTTDLFYFRSYITTIFCSAKFIVLRTNRRIFEFRF